MPKENIYNYANLLTLLRLIFTPVIVYGIISGDYILSAAFFLFSNLTDVYDGKVARKLKCETEFGEYFDFVVDFVAIYAILITFINLGIVSALNKYLLIIGTAALLFIAFMLSYKAKRAYMPHRTSSKTLAVLVSIAFYLFFFRIGFADTFLLLTFIVIYIYTIPDYIILAVRYKGGSA